MTHQITLSIPKELAEEAGTLVAKDTQTRMETVIRWSEENVKRGEGPFAAGVFRSDTGQCIGAGVNRVISSGCSIAHAEIMAILMAQAHGDQTQLPEGGSLIITSSAQPCSQCMGAIPWADIHCLEYGADRDAVQAIGFDEGPCPENWKLEYENRGIQVVGPVLQDRAVKVLRAYAGQNGQIY